MNLRFATFAAAVALLSCTDESESTRALDAYGFTDVHFTGYEFFSCGERDFSHTGFTAKNAQGRPVAGVVCCGLLFKACTVRF